MSFMRGKTELNGDRRRVDFADCSAFRPCVWAVYQIQIVRATISSQLVIAFFAARSADGRRGISQKRVLQSARWRTGKEVVRGVGILEFAGVSQLVSKDCTKAAWVSTGWCKFASDKGPNL